MTIARMAVSKPNADVMKKLIARHEWDPSITKVLLDTKGVNFIKNFDLMHAYADVDSAAMWQ